MNKILNILSATIVAIAAIACDPVSEDERFIKADDLEVDKKVLVQEFTGQFCPNCPLGHEALNNIAKVVGDNAVIVSIHAGDMAFEDEELGLKTPDGDVYAKEWGIQEYPSAVVNRKSVMSDRSQWQGAVHSALSTPSSILIDLKAQVEDGKIVIASELSTTLLPAEAKYQLWIVEDNIVALQQEGESYIEDYVHNHVYRASVNGIGGEAVSITTEVKSMTHTIPVAKNWNISNIKVVAFVYTDKDVLQAEEVKVGK